MPGRHTVALRCEVALEGTPPARVPARAFAVSRYLLRVNGAEVGRGPSRSNPRDGFWDEVDLAPFLRPGRNVVGVVAVRYDDPNAWWLPPPALGTDLAGGAFVLEAALEGFATDDGWTGTVLDGWTATRGHGVSARGRELADLRSLPRRWDSADGADPGWPAVVVRRAMAAGERGPGGPPSYPVGPHAPRRTTARRPAPVELSPVTEDAWVAERIVVGTVAIDADGPAGSEVVLQVAEFVDDEGRPRPTEHDASVSFVLDGAGPAVLETFDVFGLRGLTVSAPEGVGVRSVEVRERLHPVAGEASFSCSDDRLNRIYEMGRRTVSMCSLDAYVDCPTREQRAWAGDSVVHQLVDLTTNGDWTLARWHPRLTAGSVRPDGMLPMAVSGDVEHYDFTVIPDWALHWVHSVWNLHRYVGDEDEIAGLLPVVETVCRWFERFLRPDGLLTDIHGWCIVDWAAVYTDGVSSVMNGLWGRALLELADMARWLGDEGRARWAARRHLALQDAFEVLWDGDRGWYVDSVVGGARRPAASQHGQAAAIVGGLVPHERLDHLAALLVDRQRHVDAAHGIDGPATVGADLPIGGTLRGDGHAPPWWDTSSLLVRAQPFFRYVVHDALAAAGRADLVTPALLDWTEALVRCDTSWTETWYGGTVSHGWSSTPTRDLIQRTLGITPAEPGFAVANVQPALGPELTWARGTAPCGDGRWISVEAHRNGTVVVDAPVPLLLQGERRPPGRHEIVASATR